MPASINIGSRKVGAGSPVYVVAEMSANHGGDYNCAEETVRAAKEAGADAVKLQTYTADSLTIDCDADAFRIKETIWKGRKLYDLYREASMPWEWQPRLSALAQELGLDLFSTAFDISSLEFLESMNVDVHKIASFELVDLPLLRAVGSTGKPVILSTGMADEEEIREAVEELRRAGCDDLVLMKCVSEYPAPIEDMNLRSIKTLGDLFGCPVGLSDHSKGVWASISSVALDACVIERHFVLSRDIASADASFSLVPEEFRSMVDGIRQAEAALGSPEVIACEGEKASRCFRRSLFAVQDISAGARITHENVRCIRPGYGLHPRYLDKLIGREVARFIARGTPLTWDCVSGGKSE